MSSHALLSLTSYAVNAVWQVAILAAAAWCLSRWVKPAGPELQHKIWVAALLLAAIVPATPLIRSYFARRDQRPVSAPSAMVTGRWSAQQIPMGGADLIVRPAVVYFVSGLYLAVLLLWLVRLCWVLHRTSTLVRSADTAPAESDYAQLWHKSQERLALRSAALLQSREISGPVTAGLRRPVLLLPATFQEDYSETQFLAAMAHECAHMKRDDFRKNVLYEIVSLFTGFHPLTWFIKSQIAQTREMVCDRMAAEQLSDRRSYALSLLQLAGKMQPAAPAVSHAMGMFDSGILERRIMILSTSMPRLSRMQRALRSMTALLLLSVCAAGIGLMTRTVAAQTPASAAKKQEGPDLDCTYYDAGKGSDGTCGYDPKDKSKYRCFANHNPALSNPQVACEWKVRRFEDWKKSQK